MTGAAADVTVFHPDLYLAAAAAIPVLWVATGFATTATAAILRGLQSLGSTVKITSPYGLLRVTVSPQSSTVSFLGATVGVAGLGLSEAMAFWFVALLVVPGAAG